MKLKKRIFSKFKSGLQVTATQGTILRGTFGLQKEAISLTESVKVKPEN